MKKIFTTVIAFFVGLGLLIPSYVNAQNIDIERLAGRDRYTTAISISKHTYEKSDTVILASGEDFPDALSGGQLSLALKAPILLTQKNSISIEVLDELERLSAKKIFILGGTNAISQAIEEKLEKKYEIKRIGGYDRYETAKMIMEKTMTLGDYKNIIIATGKNYPDALSATVLLKNKDALLFLSDGNSLPKTSLNLIAIGGRNALALNDFKGERIFGENRYETSLEVSKKVFLDLDKMILASGENFPDALTAVSLVGEFNYPIILSRHNQLEASIKDHIDKNINKIIIVGGENAINEALIDNIRKSLENKPDKPSKPIEETKTDAEKTVLVDPVKVKVKDLAKLSQDEKSKVEEAIKTANPEAPIESVLVWDDGKAELTYKDGSKAVISSEKTVEEIEEMKLLNLALEKKARWDYHFTGKTLPGARVNIYEGLISYGEPKFSGIAGDDGSFDIPVSKESYIKLMGDKERPFNKKFIVAAIRKDDDKDKVEKSFSPEIDAHKVNLIRNSGIAVNLTESGLDASSGATKINYFKGDKIKLIFNPENTPIHKVFSKWHSEDIDVPEGEEEFEFIATKESYSFTVEYKDAPVPEPPTDGKAAPDIWTVFKKEKNFRPKLFGIVSIKLMKEQDVTSIDDADWLRKFNESIEDRIIMKNGMILTSAESEYGLSDENYYIKNSPREFKLKLTEGDKVEIRIPGFKNFVFYYHDYMLDESMVVN